MKKNFVFRKLSPELEEVLVDELHTLKGGTGGDSDGSMWDATLDEVVITSDPPEEEEEEEEEEEYEDPDPDFWNIDDPFGDEYGNETEDPEPDPDPKCSDAAKAANAKTSALIKNSVVSSKIGTLPAITSNSNELAFTIKKSGTSYIAGDTQNLSTNGGIIQNTNHSVADFHTHPNSNAPSAMDVIGLGSMFAQNSHFETRFIKGSDGDMYAITISDANLAKGFYNTFKDNVGSDNDWDPNSTIGQQFNSAKSAYLAAGKSSEEAYDHATAFVLNNSGITLVKAPSGSNDFTKIGTSRTVDENGNATYSNSDCPR